MKYIFIFIFIIFNTLYAYENIDYLNKIRKNVGLNELNFDFKLSYLSNNHLKYMLKEKKVTHFQNNYKNIFFSGRTINDRLNKLYPNNNFIIIGENISMGYLNDKDSINELIDSPYHRFNFLKNYDLVGFSKSNNFNGKENLIVYSLAKIKNIHNNNKIIIYPYNKQKNVPTYFFSDSEVPDPIKIRNIVGYPITLSNFKYKNIHFELINNETNVKIPIFVKNHFNDSHIRKNDYLIIPKKILKNNTKYKFFIKCSDYNNKNKIFFTTFKTMKYKKPFLIKNNNNNKIHIKYGKPPYFIKIKNKKYKLNQYTFKLINLNEKYTILDSN